MHGMATDTWTDRRYPSQSAVALTMPCPNAALKMREEALKAKTHADA